MIVFDDEYYMRLALRQAEIAFEAGEVPVGAVTVADGIVLARACNQVELLKDATAHAEMLALTMTAGARGDWRMEDVTLYVTKEPCAMCAGALVNSRVKRVVFGLPDPRSGACGSALDVTGFPGMLWQVECVGGILEAECRGLIQEFFRLVRERSNGNTLASGKKRVGDSGPEDMESR